MRATETLVDDKPTEALPELELANRYHVEAMLGRGGMGTVYRVHDGLLDEKVALKLLGRIQAAPDVDRARDEVKLARRVMHPNVARTFDAGRHDAFLFLTMELVEGPPLSRVIDSVDALSTAAAIANGLTAIHEANVVHGDMKPENVLLAADGTPKITDFGIAEALERSLLDRARGSGTPYYMAPEQWRGAPADVRTDIFSFGVMLHELFSGRRSRAIARADERAFSAALPQPPESVPRFVVELARACVAWNAEDRPSSMSLVRERLGEHSRPPPTHALVARRRLSLAVVTFEADDAMTELARALERETTRLLGLSEMLAVTSPTPGFEPADVDARLHGSVAHRPNGTVRIGLRIVSAAEGMLVTSHAFVTNTADALVALERTCHAIMKALDVSRDSGAPLGPLPSPSVTSLYLEARAHEHQWRNGSARSVECLERALEIAPDDVRILATYALVLARRHPLPDARLADARTAAERALAAAPADADTHAALALVRYMENDHVAAVQAAARASRLSPSSATAHVVVGVVAVESGLVDEGLERLALARVLDPRESMARMQMARTEALLGRFDAADALLGQDVERDVIRTLYAARFAMWRGRPSSLDSTALSAFGGDPDRLRQRAAIRETRVELALENGDAGTALEELEALAEVDGCADLLWVSRCPLLGVLRGEPRARRAMTIIEDRARRVATEIARYVRR